MEPLISLRDLHRSYEEGGRSHRVLDGVSLALARGERLALLGQSGSGKSTLLNIVAGIDLPQQGVVSVAGENLVAMSEKQRTLFRRRHIGFIYQFFNLVPTLTALENIAFVLELNAYPASEIWERSRDMLDQLDLSGRGSDFPSQLSGGEQQRVAIGRALVHRPEIVLADEPTGNLDGRTGPRILDLFYRLLDENKSTLLMVTHSRAVAESASRIVSLENGRLKDGEDGLAW